MNTPTQMKVSNLESSKGNKVFNQFEINASNGRYFQSYRSIIAYIPNDGTIQLDERYWNYSRTTSKYRSQFLGETTKETERKIKEGKYILANLN